MKLVIACHHMSDLGRVFIVTGLNRPIPSRSFFTNWVNNCAFFFAPGLTRVS